MRHLPAKLVLVVSLAATAGCGTSEQNFSKLAKEFAYTSLSFSPVAATAAGLHQYRGRKLDEELDDFSPGALDHQRHYYQRFRARLESDVRPGSLSAESRADLRIIQDQVALALLDLNEVRSDLHNPTMYVELVGNNLVLRPHNSAYPVDLIEVEEGKTFADYVVGRICHVGIET